MKGMIKTTLKKITLELVYQVVDERTEEIITKVDEIKKKQEDDFRYLIQKIDSDTGKLNQRIDTIIQMLMNFKQDQK